jgi:hypothetical protein
VQSAFGQEVVAARAFAMDARRSRRPEETESQDGRTLVINSPMPDFRGRGDASGDYPDS